MLIAILEFSFPSTDSRGRTEDFFFTNSAFFYQIIILVGEAMALYESIFFNNSICEPVFFYFPENVEHFYWLTNFLAYSSMIFNTCIDFYSGHHHYQDTEPFHHPKELLYASPNHPPLATMISSLSLCLSENCHVNGTIWYVTFWGWILSLSIMYLQLNHVVAGVNGLFLFIAG